MIYKKKIFTLFALVFISVSALAQEQMSLPQLIDFAQKNNTQSIRTNNQFSQSSANYKRNIGNLLPTINGNASHNYNYGRTIDPTTNQFIEQRTQTNFFSLNTDVLLFNGLQQINSVRQAKWAERSAYHTVQRMKDDIALTVANFYLQILMLGEREKQLKEQVSISKQQHERTKILVESGAAAPSRQLEVEAQLASDEVLLLDVQNQTINAYLQLKQYMNYDVEKELKIVEIDIKELNYDYQRTDLDKALNEQYKQNPRVMAAEDFLQSDKFGLKAAKGNISPKIYGNASLRSGYSSAAKDLDGFTLQGTQQIGYLSTDQTPVLAPNAIPRFVSTPFGTQLDNNFGQTLGFTLAIPIFNNFQNNYAIQLAKINVQNAELTLRDAQVQVKNDMVQAYENMKIAQKKFQAANAKLKAQEALFKISELSYSQGLLSYFDWNTIKSNLNNAQSEVLQAKYQHVFQTKVFEYYLGKGVQIGE